MTKYRIFIVLVVIISAGVFGCERAPVQLSQVAWNALQDSKREGAELGAPDIWSQAQARYDSAWRAIEVQNRFWFFERDFTPAESLLVRAGRDAREAVKASQVNRTRQHEELQLQLTAFTRQLTDYRIDMNGHIARIPLRKALTEAELTFATFKNAYLAGDIDKALAVIPDVESAITELQSRIELDWVDPAEIPKWNKMVHETVRWSQKNGSTALVVVKVDRRAYLLKSGRIVEDFPVEFGYRAWAQKMRSGDGATPEGIYQVTKWRDRDTKYYKALNINYPNESDRKRFAINKKIGKIPQNAGIGGLIEIHGKGGKGEDWTEGCVALANADMDRLMAKMNVGDRVTIVREVSGWPN